MAHYAKTIEKGCAGLCQAPLLLQRDDRDLRLKPLLIPAIHMFFRPEEQRRLSHEHYIIPPLSRRDGGWKRQTIQQTGIRAKSPACSWPVDRLKSDGSSARARDRKHERSGAVADRVHLVYAAQESSRDTGVT